MNLQLLIDSIVRQTTVLIAQIATSGGVRAPLAHVADQVFLELSTELEAQGVSRKVSADMFGLALRSYVRRIRRASESSTERGQSLWEAVLAFVTERSIARRPDIIERFARDDDAQVRAVLRDLTESGLLFATGSGAAKVYRAPTSEEIETMSAGGQGLDELVWALVYREGPLGREDLARRGFASAHDLDATLSRLVESGRVTVTGEPATGRYSSSQLIIPLGAPAGWEAALFDHFSAVVKTMVRRLSSPGSGSGATTGGSTYTFDIWEGHPHEAEILGTLQRFREECSELREKMSIYNGGAQRPSEPTRVIVYAGQCVIEGSGEEPEPGKPEEK